MTFSYGDGEYALCDVDAARAAGPDRGARRRDRRRQVHASPSSWPASTTPTTGASLVDGHDLRDVTEHSLRSQLGIVPQESFLFSGTIRDNIAFGRPDATDEEVLRRRPRRGRRTSFIERLPEGYDTEVGERGGHLSAGQRQLVAFARAAAADPRILILDEATSNVDVRTEAQIEHGLRRLLAGRTALVIAHRLSTIRGAGRIVVLDARPDRRAGHARRAAGRGRRLRAPVPRLGGAGRGLGLQRPGAWLRSAVVRCSVRQPSGDGEWCNRQHDTLWMC